MVKKFYTRSCRKTCWDNHKNSELECTEKFIMKTYKNDYKINHLELDKTYENIWINKAKIKCCPYCGSDNFIKRGRTKSGIQRYFCKSCNKTFTPITNTIFDDHKLSIDQYVKFLINIFHYSSLESSRRNNKNSSTTSRYWLEKLFLVLKDLQSNTVLEGKIYLDETYYSIEAKSKIIKEERELRGLSRNQFCIGVATDGKNVIAIVEGKGKPSSKRTLNAFKSHLKPGSVLFHDKEKSHNALVELLSLKSITFDANEIKKLSGEDNPLNPINKVHSLLKKFLSAHSGFNKAYLQDYLNLFVLLSSSPFDVLEKVKKTLNLSLECRVSLKYRDFYRIKDEK